MNINVKGQLMDLAVPKIMGILNVTPDSFFAESRRQTDREIALRIQQLYEEKADIIDVGACSTRPGATIVSEADERARLDRALEPLFREYPEAIVSVDTFRAGIARHCVETYGVAIVNDISGGDLDSDMFQTVARLRVPYILMHMRGTPETMNSRIDYGDFHREIIEYFVDKVSRLRRLGVNDIIIDPGFGFSKNTAQNFALMAMLDDFSFFRLPLLVGISRKTMIRETLHCSVDDSLNATTVLNVYALLNGANILRVHDVREAVEAVTLLETLKNASL
jgi:dihydropteroate synthase